MSRRWLLSLLCLSVLIALLAPLSRARGELKVNEARTRFLLEKEPAEVLLAVENSTGESLNSKVELEVLDPLDRVISKVAGVHSIGTGEQTLKLTLPLYFSKLKAEDRRLLWHRLHYRISKDGQSESISQGIISLSEITSDLFELRVASSEIAREGNRYKARVFASHPVTHKPAANVVIDGELTLEEDEEKGVKLHNSRTTDMDGIAVLEFAMPKRFPEFPHMIQPSGGELKVVGKRGAFVAEAEGQALVDQFLRTLVTTDKPLYQPGQTIHVRALIFTPSRHAFANRNILFKIDDPQGTAVHRSVVKSSRFGIANTEWSIPENVRLGDYRIHVLVDGGSEEGGETSDTLYDVRISRYDLPNFSVTTQSDREYYLPGQNAEVRVRANYLFGQPVKRGHVRVVRETQREWNYREQKWDVEEDDAQKGETDANGVFVARLDLSSYHEKLGNWDYGRFEDVTYQAYFTDPTTNRTEQRRFDLRITKDPIHVYVIRDDHRNRTAPLRFFVSTAYADGSPARCKVNVTLSGTDFDSRFKKRDIITRPLVTVRTNRYGVAKVSGVQMPRDFEKEDETILTVSATDANGRTGKRTENLRVDDDHMTSVDTGKTLYRAGEPVVVSVTSTVPDETVFVELTQDSYVIRSERVQLRNGRGSVTFPYKPEFKNQIIVAAFPMYLNHRTIEAATILYPRDVELKVNARTSQTTYRPGENAHVTLDVRAPEGRGAESALSVVVSDKAVAERYRTTQEFGGNYFSYNESLKRFMDIDLEFAGVTLRDLQRLDTSKIISRDLDLLAEVMLNQGRSYTPQHFGGDQYDTAQADVFAELIKREFEPVKEVLTRRYLSKTQYPNDEASLNALLAAEKIDSAHLLDPWGVPYRPVFSLEGPADVLTFTTAGADKRFGTVDDFKVERFSWRYFLSLGAVIDAAVRHYHERTGGFIRHLGMLRDELAREGVILDQLRDRWGQPYRFDFSVHQSNYMLTVSSGGPDKVFSEHEAYRGDDFDIWTTPIDYFAESRIKIQEALDRNLKSTWNFPQTEKDLSDVLRNSGNPLDALRDPWGRPYYATFLTQSSYADRAQPGTTVRVGDSPVSRMTLTPVTQKVANIFLRSTGYDGVAGTRDDFMVANFKGVLSEEVRGDSIPQTPASQLGSNGAIHGIVTDVMGASVARTQVTATNTSGGTRYETYSNEDGKFVISDLPHGIYEVRFQALGFKDLLITHLLVAASTNTEVSAVLEAGQVTEAVTVSTSLPEVATERSVNASRSSAEALQFRVITRSGSSSITTPHLREYFPETLLWQPSVETDKQGRARVNFNLPTILQPGNLQCSAPPKMAASGPRKRRSRRSNHSLSNTIRRECLLKAMRFRCRWWCATIFRSHKESTWI
jgi:hypothetical protein